MFRESTLSTVPVARAVREAAARHGTCVLVAAAEIVRCRVRGMDK
jgi:hypothetical protein